MQVNFNFTSVNYTKKANFESNLEMAWILTRSPTPAADTLEKAYAVLDRNKISKSYLIHTDQINCNKD